MPGPPIAVNDVTELLSLLIAHLAMWISCIYCREIESRILKGHSGAELYIYFLVHLESIYYQIFFYSKIVPNCAVAK